jgi:hypothetical protein
MDFGEGDLVRFRAMQDPLNGDETLVQVTGIISRVWTNGKYVTILTDVICACCDKPRTFVRFAASVELIEKAGGDGHYEVTYRRTS